MKYKNKLASAISLLIFLVLSACATPPDQDFSSLRANDPAQPAAHTDYVAQQQTDITGVAFTGGNRVELLRDGSATFPAMLAAIKRAKHYIYMESFTFDEKAGRRFAQEMVARRKAGVKVDLIYDAFGSSDTPPGIFDYLRRNGVTLVEYDPIGVADVIDGDADQRDHRKILVVDGEEVFVGGVNISAVYLHKKKIEQTLHMDGANAYKHLPWRDTHVRIMGPSVADFEKIYKRTWHEQHGRDNALSSYKPAFQSRGDLSIAALTGAPVKDHYSIYEALRLAITLSQHSVYLTTGYFVPTPGLKDVLIAAAKRGVDVRLLLPSASDSELALAAGHADYTELLEAGIKIYEFQNEVLHAKTAVIDGVWSTVGSSNLDWRSAAINNECNAVILGPAFGNEMNAMFQDDLSHSKQISLEEWSDRPFDERLDEFKASLIDYFL